MGRVARLTRYPALLDQWDSNASSLSGGEAARDEGGSPDGGPAAGFS